MRLFSRLVPLLVLLGVAVSSGSPLSAQDPQIPRSQIEPRLQGRRPVIFCFVWEGTAESLKSTLDRAGAKVEL